MEASLAYEEILEGHRRFSKFVNYPFNKQLILDTIDNCINGEQWPKSYYSLRDEYLPNIIGQEASKFLFWFIFAGYSKEIPGIKFNENEKVLLKHIFYNYAGKFVRAKLFNLNPLGFHQIDYTHMSDEGRFNAYITRNDEKTFVLRTNLIELSDMLTDSLFYLNQMVSEHAIEYNEQKAELLDNIEQMKASLNSMERIINSGEQADD